MCPGRQWQILKAFAGIMDIEGLGEKQVATLQEALAAQGRRIARVDEVLREFCDAHGRTPQRHEQAGIAAESDVMLAGRGIHFEIWSKTNFDKLVEIEKPTQDDSDDLGIF